MALEVAPWKAETAIARQALKTLETRLTAHLATIDAGLFASPYDYMSLTVPVAFWRQSPALDFPSEAYDTPSVGLVLTGTDDTGIGDAQTAWELSARFALFVMLAPTADNGARSAQDVCEITEAYSAACFQVLSTHLQSDASAAVATTESLGYGLPVVYVTPGQVSPVSVVDLTQEQSEARGGGVEELHVAQFEFSVSYYHTQVY